MLSTFWRRLRVLLHRNQEQEDLRTEMELHRDLRAAQLRRDGLSPDEADRQSRVRFGNETVMAERSADAWGLTSLQDIGKDFKLAARVLLSSPLFTAVVVITLALGIGANTAIFSAMNAVVLRALPVPNPTKLVYLRIPQQPSGASNTGNSNSSFSEPVFEELRKEGKGVLDVMAYVPLGIGKVSVRVDTMPEEAAVEMVSGNFFSGIGVKPLCGRLVSEEDETQHTSTVVLNYGYAFRSFSQPCEALGRKVSIKGVPFTVVGVAPAAFRGVESYPTDAWIPLQNRPDMNAWGQQENLFYREPNWWCLRLIGRVADNISEKEAIARLDPVLFRTAYAPLGGKPRKGETPIRLSFIPARGLAEGGELLEGPLQILMAMVGLILVIACGNISLLLSARNTARQREFSIRLALGGSQMRLFRQLMAESVLIVVAGGVVGFFLAIAGTQALSAWADIQTNMEPDRSVLVFSAAISIVAAVAFSLAPLLTSTRVPLGLALKTSASTAFRDKARLSGGRMIAACQVALCVIILAGSGLLVRSLRNLEHESLGFRSDGLLVFGVNMPSRTPEEASLLYQRLLDRIQQTPGVTSATFMENRLGSGWSNNTSALIDGKQDTEYKAAPMRWNGVGPNYFTVLGVPILRGRDFNAADGRNAPKVAIVNKAFAEKYFAGRDPIGHLTSFSPKTPFTIIGIAANSKYTSLREETMPMAYFPALQIAAQGELHYVVRAGSEPLNLVPALRKTIAEELPDAALLRPKTQRAEFDSTIDQERLLARLAIGFGILAVLLVSTGLYGTIAYGVTRRTAEIGIRMALGAHRFGVLWMVLKEGLTLCVVGICIGLPIAFASSKFLGSILYGLLPHDPATMAAAVLCVLLVTSCAALLPARRASLVEPLRALRYE